MAVNSITGYRTEKKELLRQNNLIVKNKLLLQTINGMNIFVIILNKRREIVFMNSELCEALQVGNEEILGIRPGELLRCKYSNRNELGCGYASECALCEAKNIVMEVIHNGKQVKRDVSIVSNIEGDEVTSSFEECASKINIDDEDFYLVAFVDRSSEVDQSNLAKIFYHDVLNSATSVFNVIRLLKMENEKFREDEDIAQIQGYIQNIIEEIQFQRSISFAEKDDLEIEYKRVDLDKMVRDIIAVMKADQRFNHVHVNYERSYEDLTIDSEPILIRRIINNLLKNAFEANRNHSVVRVTAEIHEENISICVHNDEVIPDEIKRFIYEKGYSSKGKGRGFGTYGSKLLLNKYLNGQITFESNEEKGTRFKLLLPKEA